MEHGENGAAPNDLREGVRSGIVAALQRDVERRGGRTARRLATAGVVGVTGAVGITLMLAGHPFGHHPSWHAVVFGAVWAGLLVVCLSFSLLEVRTPSLPLAQAALVGMFGLGLAGLCGAVCPDQHFLKWWSRTAVGSGIAELGGLAPGALCFGLVSAFVFGTGAALLGPAQIPRMRPLLPAAMLLMLLAPGIALQSVGTSWGVFAGWLLGSGAGAYGGVASGLWIRFRVGR